MFAFALGPELQFLYNAEFNFILPHFLHLRENRIVFVSTARVFRRFRKIANSDY